MPNSDLIVRKLDPEDIDVFRMLRLEALQKAPGSFASSYDDWVALPKEEWIRRMTEDPVFAAFRSGKPVGIMGLLREKPSKMAHRASLILVYVVEQERGSGAAAKLLAYADRYAGENGISQLELNASAENPAALRFYQREGFVEIGRIPAGFRHDGKDITDVLMMRPVKTS